MQNWKVNLHLARYSELLLYRARFETDLSDDEHIRAARLLTDDLRAKYIVGRGFLRHTLGQYLNTPIMFHYGKRNKPTISGISFNLSHSEDVLLLAITSGEVLLGVDVEAMRPMKEMPTVARDNFSPHEYQQWSALPQEKRPAAFYTCWTRKEAYIKAVGDGFALPLDAFDVTFTPEEPPRLLRAEGDDPARWSLYHLEPAAGYVGALCIAGNAELIYQF